MIPLRFRPEVADDLTDARSWYEERRQGLGDELLDEVERCVRGIATTPLVCQVVHREVRRSLVRRFPYAIYFVFRDGEITVLAVLHAHRDPAAWRSRA